MTAPDLAPCPASDVDDSSASDAAPDVGRKREHDRKHDRGLDRDLDTDTDTGSGPGTDWTALLADPQPVRDVLGVPVPPLAAFNLFVAHFDERDSSLTVAFEAFEAPAGALAEWAGNGHDALEFFLVFTGVTEVEVDGWSHRPTNTVILTERSAVFAGPAHQISFAYREVSATRPRGYRAGTP
ncbi:Imm50 family immunity protein [Kitasatospora sp. NPDC127111]|uniref:Imm50 family immunity protein n=1 Tax=Kitasatospora sp. NPDC127111 TaxID=3345363 RepID=UPI00362E3943